MDCCAFDVLSSEGLRDRFTLLDLWPCFFSLNLSVDGGMICFFYLPLRRALCLPFALIFNRLLSFLAHAHAWKDLGGLLEPMSEILLELP